MILGVFEMDPAARVDAARLRAVMETAVTDGTAVVAVVDGPVGIAGLTPRGEAPPAAAGFHHAQRGPLTGALMGSLYGAGAADANPAERILDAYAREGGDCAAGLNGRFAGVVYDRDAHRLFVYRDALGIEALFYWLGPKRVVFASSLHLLRRAVGERPALEPNAVARFLLFNYNPGSSAFYRGMMKLRPGYYLSASREGTAIQPYWRLDFGDTLPGSEREIAGQLIEGVRDAVRRCLPSGMAPGVFVSGGLDSSTVLSVLREQWSGPIHTYSYRCKSESFDESRYARRMAESVGAEHHEVEYRPADALLIQELAARMNEPFCDQAINVATYLLAREARGREHFIFTGDGGDELFGGHPIYEADKIARFVDPVPAVLRRPMLAAMASLPDSDRKKDLKVKLKRFGESAMFPRELLSHRWRLYYRLDELGDVLAPGFLSAIERDRLFADVLTINAEGDGPDMLSRSLYSDYQTIVDFYLRRNDLFRDLGLETRYPLFDRELVEFCARIPSRLKVHGWFDTKYIFKKAIEDVVPRDIVYRQDKLGHSIPLKNWLRDTPIVRDFVLDHLSASALERRGIVRPAYVQRLIEDHSAKRRNNAHRLWTLAVLEMWCRAHLDEAR